MTDLLHIARLVRAHPPRVTVIGDAILDRWMHGGVTRLSREGPVPVVEVADRADRPGGAANTAANLAALGASVRLLSVVGDDADGRVLLRLLQDAGVDTAHVAVVPGGVTATKTRIVGSDQILVRADVAAANDTVPDADVAAWREAVAAMPAEESLLVCDYAGGLLTPDLAHRVGIDRSRARVIVDAHDLAAWRGLHPAVVTPNADEAARLLGAPLQAPEGRPQAVARRSAELLMASGAHAAVVTLDRDGSVVVERGAGVTHTTASRPVPEVQATGAGDAYAAALAVALGVGCELPAAADFAQAAALVVVERTGTAVCRLDDLERSARPPRAASLLSAAQLSDVLREAAAARTTVFVNGCFDLLHAGHAAHLEQARALGDLLVVGLNDDASTRRLKGPGRPVNPVADRARVVAALGCVDFVVVFGEDSPLRLLDAIRPDIYAKGGDYADERLPEMELVERNGGTVRILDFFADHSTASLVERIAHTSRRARERIPAHVKPRARSHGDA